MNEEQEASTWRKRLTAALPYLLIVAVGVVVLLPKLGEFGLWDPWEPKYVESAREMVERGSYFVPYYRDKVRLTKPILSYWGVIAGTAVFGMNEFGARIGGVLLALASMCGVFYTVSLLRSRRAGLLAALVLGTSPLFYLLARQATPDVYVFTTLGTSLMFLWLGLFGPDKRRDLHFVVSYVCFALAVLAKGPVIAIPIYFVPLAIFAVAHLDFGRLWAPGVRPTTTRALWFGIPAAIGLPLFAYGSWLFATSPDWQGYSERSRNHAAGQRDQVLALIEPIHLVELVLCAIVLLAGWAAYRWFRQAQRPGRLALAIPVSLGIAALGVLVGLNGTSKIAVTTVLGGLACAVIVVNAARHLASHPDVIGDVRDYLRPIRRQATFFLGVVTLVAGPWHAVIFYSQRHGYFSDFILKHNVGRIADDINSSGVSDFYLRTLIFGLFPWCCLLPIGIASVVRSWDRDRFDRYRTEAYLLVMIVTIFVAFSIPATKFPYYLAPILLPVAALIGLTLDRMLDLRDFRTARMAWTAALMLYLPAMFDLLREGNMKYFVGSFTVKRAVRDGLEPGAYFTVLLLAMAAFLALLVLIRSRIVIGGAVLCAVLIANYGNATFIPRITPHKTMKHLVESWRLRRASNEPIGLFGSVKHGLYFYTKDSIRYIASQSDFLSLADPDYHIFCIVERKKLNALKAGFQARYPGHELVVVDNSHLSHVLIANHPVGPPRTEFERGAP